MKKHAIVFGLCLLSLLAALSVLAGGVAWGSPKDVRGSGNVAVCGYTNSAGDFVLWSSGRITNRAGSDVNAAKAYDTASGYSLPTRVTGNILGSSAVAVDAFVNEKATYVVFSDGTVKKPRNAEAAAPAETDGGRVVTGVNVRHGMSKSGNNGWTCKLQNRSLPYYTEVIYNKKFASAPVVLVDTVSYFQEHSSLSQIGGDRKIVRCISEPTGFKLYFYLDYPQEPSNHKKVYLPERISFIAYEDEAAK
ncbi:hypothetical protein IJT17_09295 [bacterium]|nr:hypothetical protein [bacterium]